MQFLFAGRPCRFVNQVPQVLFFPRVGGIPSQPLALDPPPPIDDFFVAKSRTACSCTWPAHLNLCAYNGLLSASFHLPKSTVLPQPLPSATFKMAEFVRAQIFGTTFEITSRFVAALALLPHSVLIAPQIHGSSTRRYGSFRSGLVSMPALRPRAANPMPDTSIA